jgi:predicted NBD/HSP70 family sugar kinase
MSQKSKSPSSYGSGELFQQFRDFEPHTRAELSTASGLARSTVGMRLDPLVEIGLIRPAHDAQSTGGRPSAQLIINPRSRLVAGIDFGATHAAVAISDLAAEIQVVAEEKLPISSGPEECLSWATSKVCSLLDQLGVPLSILGAIGIGLPGPVEHSTGRPSKPPIMPGWDNFDVPGRVHHDLPGVAVLVDNDVNVMALGERHTSFSDTDHMIFIKAATGIGSGIVSNGDLIRGAQGTAGDIGHVRVSRGEGVACRCGNYGCLEALAGVPAVLAAAKERGLSLTGVSELIDAVEAGELEAVQAVRQAGRDIGEVLTTCVSLVNPSVIVIGGSLSRAGENLLAGVREAVYGRSTPLATGSLSIVQSSSGSEAGIIGASVLAIEHLLSPGAIDTALDKI